MGSRMRVLGWDLQLCVFVFQSELVQGQTDC